MNKDYSETQFDLLLQQIDQGIKDTDASANLKDVDASDYNERKWKEL